MVFLNQFTNLPIFWAPVCIHPVEAVLNIYALSLSKSTQKRLGFNVYFDGAIF
jgi:hypothetical protein